MASEFQQDAVTEGGKPVNPDAEKWSNMDVKGWNTPKAEEDSADGAQAEPDKASDVFRGVESSHEMELVPSEVFEQTMSGLYRKLESSDDFDREAYDYLELMNFNDAEDYAKLSPVELSKIMSYSMLIDGKSRLDEGRYPLDVSFLVATAYEDGSRQLLEPFSGAALPLWGDDAQVVKVRDLINIGEACDGMDHGDKITGVIEYSDAEVFAQTYAENIESGVSEKDANEQSFDQMLIGYLQREFMPSSARRGVGLESRRARTAALEHLYAKYGKEDDSEVTQFLDGLVIGGRDDYFISEHSDLFKDKMADYISSSIDVMQAEKSTDVQKQAAKKSIDYFIQNWQSKIDEGLKSEDESERERATELLSVMGSCLRWTDVREGISQNIDNPAFRDGIIKAFDQTGGINAENLNDDDYELIKSLAGSGLNAESQDAKDWAINILEKSCDDPIEKYKDRPGIVTGYCYVKVLEQISSGDKGNDESILQYLQTIQETSRYDVSLGGQSKALMEACLDNKRFDIIPTFAGLFNRGGEVLLQYLGQANEKGDLTKEQLGLLYKIPPSQEIEISQVQLSRRAIAESGDFEYMLAHANEFNDGDFVHAFESQSNGGKDQDALLETLRKCYGERGDDKLLEIYEDKKKRATEAMRRQSLEGGGHRNDYGLMDFVDAVLEGRKNEERDALCGIELQRRFNFEYEEIEPLLSSEEKARMREAMELTEREGELAERLKQLSESSSTELRTFAPFVLERAMIAESEDETGATTAEKYLDDIARFFEDPNMPTYQKLARAAIYFNISKGGEDIQKEGTPALRVATRYEQARIISSDLMRSSMRSGNRGLKEFLISINAAEQGLSEDVDPLTEFAEDDPRRKMFETAGRMQMEASLATGYNLLRPIDILKEMEKVRSERDAQNRAQVIEDPNNKGHFILRAFSAEDYIKGGKANYLDTQMQNGFVSPEMLGAFSDQDVTHWDSDTATGSESLKAMQSKRGGGVTIPELLANTSAHAGDDVVMILRKDERFIETSDDDVIYRPGVYEMYKRASSYENFRGCRTGFGAMDVDVFAVNKESQNLARLSFEIAKNGCYIPIVNKVTGEVIFTPEDFDREREKFSGLTEYGTLSFEDGDVMSDMAEYHFSDRLDIPASLTDGLNSDISFDTLVSGFEDKKAETAKVHETLKTDIIEAVLRSDLFDEEFKQRFAAMGDSLGNSELGTINMFSTGSTGRNANVPHDGDYDLMFTMDESDIKKNMPKLSGLLKERYHAELVAGGDLRSGKLEVQLPDGSTQEIDIDISFTKKIDRMRASTDMILARRYDAMRGSPEEQKKVVANVIIAKALMKQAGCYKKVQSKGADAEKGGIGGIGVENWILQNHGSLYEAAKSFVEASDKAGYGTGESQDDAFAKFKQHYAIFDMGQNFHNISHKKGYNEYPYDNMITSTMRDGTPNFKVGGWVAMYEVCQRVLAAYDG